MKNKIIILCALVVLCAFALGFSGLVDMSSGVVAEDAERDRLVGIFVTTTYLDLFDYEAYFSENVGEILGGGPLENTEQYQNRLYGRIITTERADSDGQSYRVKSVEFPGVEGWLLACLKYKDANESYSYTVSDEIFCDVHTHITATDFGDGIKLEASVYAVPSEHCVYYNNPVYQTPEGEIYLVPGMGDSFGGIVDEGMAMSAALSEKKSFTQNGETTELESEIKISTSMEYPPESIAILCFGVGGELLSKSEFSPDSVPGEIDVPKGTMWLVLESRKTVNGEERVTRELYDRQDDGLNFFRQKGSFCLKEYSKINWEE